jgi:NADH-quinone oxidoreductase subunit G
MEGYEGLPPSGLITRYWSPGWNSIQALNKFQQEVGGLLRDGDPGIFLIKPFSCNSASFFATTPSAIQIGIIERLLIPIYHIFGSEELSMVSPAVKERAPEPYLALNPDDPLAIDEEISFTLGDIPYILPVKKMPGLPLHCAGLPAGLPELPFASLPSLIKIPERIVA